MGIAEIHILLWLFDQFFGKKPKPSKVISHAACQRKFYKQLCGMLLSLCTANEPFHSISSFVKDAAIVSTEGDIKEEDSDVEAPLKSLDVKGPKDF